jgi:hypothetical protein
MNKQSLLANNDNPGKMKRAQGASAKDGREVRACGVRSLLARDKGLPEEWFEYRFAEGGTSENGSGLGSDACR